MLYKAIPHLVCPKEEGELKLYTEKGDDESVEEGGLKCEICQADYPIREGIPDFTNQDNNYTDNFGFQWNKFRELQLDSFSKLKISSDRFFDSTGWPKLCHHQEIALEVGCGAGRFTEIAAGTGVELFSVDSSSAIEANQKNNSSFKRVHFIKADLRALPFKKNSFDRVFCLGVLQHTPSPKQSFLKLLTFVKKDGGRLSCDVYSKTWQTYFWSKYWLRFISTRVSKKSLFRWVELTTPMWLKVHDVLRFIPWVGRPMAYLLVPVCTYKYTYPLKKDQNKQWALLDTFDMLSPSYDIPCSLEEVKGWLDAEPTVKKEARFGANGIVMSLQRK